MKVYINSELILELKEIHQKVIQNDVLSEKFDEDMKRRVQYVLTHKYERCLERLKKEWLPKLSERMDTIPTNNDQLCELIFSQPDYKNRSQREPEGEAM